MRIMQIFIITLCMASFFLACSAKSKDRSIDYTSPCACYDLIKISKNKG